MSIFGNFIVENQCEDSDLDSVLEGTCLGSFSIIAEAKRIPPELRLDVSDIISASTFKSKTKKVLEYMKEEGYSDKQISKTVYMWYYSIIGNTVGLEQCRRYEPRMSYYFDLVNKYCTEKHKKLIKKDVEKTIPAIKKYKEKNDNSSNPKDISKNLAYLDDLEKNISKLK